MKQRERQDIPIPLSVFNPSDGLQTLSQTVRRSGIAPHISFNPKENWLALRTSFLGRAARRRPLEFFLSGRGEHLANSGSEAIYHNVRKIFQLSAEHENPVTFWERHMNKANDVVTDLVDQVAPTDRNLYWLLDETAIVRSPGKLYMLLNSPKTSKRLKFELTRQVALALTSAQLEAEKRKASHTLKEVRDWLNVDLFDHGQEIGSGTRRKVRSIHDPITNRLLHLEGAPDSPGDSSTEGIIREQSMRMRYVEGVGFVVSNPRLKRSKEATKKALLMALERKNGNTDIVASTVKDRIGMMFTVADQFYNSSESVTELMGKVKAVIQKRFHLPDSAFENNDNNDGYSHQRGVKSKFRRMLVTFPGLKEPLEMVFTAMGEQIDRDNHIGIVDENGTPHTPDHQAHALYEAARNLRAFQLLFPSGDPELYGTIDYDKITKEAYARKIAEIQNSHVVEGR